MIGADRYPIDPLASVSPALQAGFAALAAARRDLATAEAAHDSANNSRELFRNDSATARRLGEACDLALERAGDAWRELMTCGPCSLVDAAFLVGLWLHDDRWGMIFRSEGERVLEPADIELFCGLFRELERQLGEVRGVTMIKVGCHGHCSLAHPMAEPGETATGATVYRVTGVPASVAPAAVLLAFQRTVLWSPGVFSVPFDALGPGRLYSAPGDDRQPGGEAAP